MSELQEKTAGQERIVYLDLLRIFSCCSVILLHIASADLQGLSVGSSYWRICNAINSGVRWSVPVFLMISGAVMLSSRHTHSFKYVITRNVLRVIAAYAFWNLAYGSLHYHPGLSLGEAIDFLSEAHYHLWYLLMIAAMYLLTPILKTFVTNDKQLHWLLAISGFSLFVVYPIPRVLSGTDLSFYLKLPYLLFDGIYRYMPSPYLFYYLIGFYLATHPISTKARYRWYCAALVSYLLTVFFTLYNSRHTGSTSTYLYDIDMPNIAVMAVSVFLFFQHEISGIPFPERVRRIIRQTAKYSFGIYLVHDFFLIMLRFLPEGSVLRANSILSVLLTFLSVFSASYLVTALLHRIPLLRKYIC